MAANNLAALLSLYSQFQNAGLAEQLNAQYAQQLNAANTANEYRYQQGLGELAGLRGRTMDEINQIGAQQAKDTDRYFTNNRADVNQSLMRRGVLGTSQIAPELTNVTERQADSQNRLAEQLRLARMGADQSTTGSLVNFIQNRSDQAPEMNQLIAMQQGLGNAGFGGGIGFPMTGGGSSPFIPGSMVNGSNIQKRGGMQMPSSPMAGYGGMTRGPESLGWQPGGYAPQLPGGGGYPSVNNGVVQGFVPPTLPGMSNGMGMGGGMGGSPMPGMRTRSNSNSIQGQLEQSILQALNQMNQPARGRRGSNKPAPVKATGDLSPNANFYRNQGNGVVRTFGDPPVGGRVISIPGNPVQPWGSVSMTSTSQGFSPQRQMGGGGDMGGGGGSMNLGSIAGLLGGLGGLISRPGRRSPSYGKLYPANASKPPSGPVQMQPLGGLPELPGFPSTSYSSPQSTGNSGGSFSLPFGAIGNMGASLFGQVGNAYGNYRDAALSAYNFENMIKNRNKSPFYSGAYPGPYYQK